MSKSLLAKARTFDKKPDKETAALSMAWLAGELTFGQVQKALDLKPGSGVYVVLARGLRDAVKLGLLKVSA